MGQFWIWKRTLFDIFKLILLKYTIQHCYNVLISTVQKNDSAIHIYIYSFSYSFPLWFITGYWIQFPVVYSRNLLFIHPIYENNSLHLLTSNFQFFPPSLLSPLIITNLFSTSRKNTLLIIMPGKQPMRTAPGCMSLYLLSTYCDSCTSPSARTQSLIWE